MDFFLKFFTLTMMESMVRWTNSALQAIGEPRTTLAEMRAFFGVILVMGLVAMKSIYDYWSNRRGLRNQLIATTLTRKRFISLSMYLRCTNPDDDPNNWSMETADECAHFYNHTKKHPLYKVQPLWDDVLRRCQENFHLGKNLSIDEAMIRYKGFKAFVKKFFMPSKPIRAGFKVYAVQPQSTRSRRT